MVTCYPLNSNNLLRRSHPTLGDGPPPLPHASQRALRLAAHEARLPLTTRSPADTLQHRHPQRPTRPRPPRPRPYPTRFRGVHHRARPRGRLLRLQRAQSPCSTRPPHALHIPLHRAPRPLPRTHQAPRAPHHPTSADRHRRRRHRARPLLHVCRRIKRQLARGQRLWGRRPIYQPRSPPRPIVIRRWRPLVDVHCPPGRGRQLRRRRTSSRCHRLQAHPNRALHPNASVLHLPAPHRCTSTRLSSSTASSASASPATPAGWPCGTP